MSGFRIGTLGDDRERSAAPDVGRKPGLFVIGAMKSGTNYLRKLLQLHPSIFMTEVREPSYFVDPGELKAIWPEMWAHGYWREERNYLQLFASAGEATVIGEASTNYAKIPLVTGVAKRLHAFNPDARQIYLLRDPIERTMSHYWHMVRYHNEYRPIETVIRRDPQYLAVSHYAMQLAPFHEHFGSDRVAVLTYEQLISDPYTTMESLYRWLGLDLAGVDVSKFREPENSTPEVFRMPAWNGIARKLWQSPPVKVVKPYLPRVVQASLRRATNHYVPRQAIDITGAIDFLRSIQRRQVDELSGLLNRGFPEWTTLNGGDEAERRRGARAAEGAGPGAAAVNG
jgi:hypothetical protein